MPRMGKNPQLKERDKQRGTNCNAQDTKVTDNDITLKSKASKGKECRNDNKGNQTIGDQYSESIPFQYYVQTHARILLRQLQSCSSSFYLDWDNLTWDNLTWDNLTWDNGNCSTNRRPDSLNHLLLRFQSCLDSHQSFATLLFGPPNCRQTNAIQTAAFLANRVQQRKHSKLRREATTPKRIQPKRSVKTSIPDPPTLDVTYSLTPIYGAVMKLCVVTIPGINSSEISCSGSVYQQLFKLFKLISNDDLMRLFIKRTETMQPGGKLIKVLESIRELNYVPILVLENMENLVFRTKQTVLYKLFNLIHSKSICLGIIGTTSTLNLLSRFEKRVKSRFGLSRICCGMVPPIETLNLIIKRNITMPQNFEYRVNSRLSSMMHCANRFLPINDTEKQIEECKLKFRLQSERTVMYFKICNCISTNPIELAIQGVIEAQLQGDSSYPQRKIFPLVKCPEEFQSLGYTQPPDEGGNVEFTTPRPTKKQRIEGPGDGRGKVVEEGPSTSSVHDSANEGFGNDSLLDYSRFLDWEGYYHDKVAVQLCLAEKIILIGVIRLYKQNVIPKTWQLVLREIHVINKKDHQATRKTTDETYRICFLRLLDFKILQYSSFDMNSLPNTSHCRQPHSRNVFSAAVKYIYRDRFEALRRQLFLPSWVETAWI